MNKVIPVSKWQFFSMLLISRILVTLTYIPSINSSINSTDNVIQTFFSMILIMIIFIPIYKLMKSNTDMLSFSERFEKINPLAGKVSALLLLIGYIFIILRVLFRFELFATTVIFPHSDFRFFMVILILLACYCARLGINGLFRTAGFILIIILISIAAVGAFTSDNFNVLNASSPFNDGIKPVLMGTISSVSLTLEGLIIASLTKYTDLSCYKKIYPWIICSFLFAAFVAVLVACVLGDYEKSQLFPVYSLCAMVKHATIERLDALLTSVWIGSIFLKICVCMILSSDMMNLIIKPKRESFSLILITIILITVVVFYKTDFNTMIFLGNNLFINILFILLTLILPLVLLFFERKMKKNEKNADYTIDSY